MSDLPDDERITPDADIHDPARERTNRLLNGAGSNVGNPVDGASRDLSNNDKQTKGFYNPKGDSVDADKLNGLETGAALGAGGLAAGAGLFNPAGEGRKGLMGRFGISISRRKGITGGIIGLMLGGGVFLGIGVGSGPLQVLHLGEILQHSFSKNESDSSNRTNKLFRFARAAGSGDIGDTKVGILGRKVFGTTIKQLSDIGVTIDRGPSGAPLRTNIDTEKLKTAFPEMEGMSDADAKSFIAGKINGISPTDITGTEGRFTIDQSKFGIKTASLVSKSTVGVLGDGKIIAAMKARILSVYLNLPSLFHPVKRAVASKENAVLNAKQIAQEEKQAQEARQAAEVAAAEAADPEGAAAVADAEEKSSGLKSGAVKALTLTGGACLARGISGDVVGIDRAKTELPAAAGAVSIIALAAQFKSGQDFTLGQMGAAVSNLTDSKGKSVWQAGALEGLAGETSKGLSDLSPDRKQAFTSHNTANRIKSYADNSIGGGASAAVLCSAPGQIIQGITAIVIAAVAEFGTGGAATGPLTAAEVGLFAAKTSAQFAETAVFMHYLEKFILNKTTATALAKDAFSGPEGGNLLAYGSRAAANMAGFASGGIELGNKASTILADNQAQQDRQQFESESLFARIFDAQDYHSLAGHLADTVSPSFGQNVSSLLGGIMHPGSWITGLSSVFMPQASALDQQGVNWSFSQVGIPQFMLNEPELADPYANASQVASIASGDSSYIDRAMTCFGVSVAQTDGGWDAVARKAVDPNEDSYINAHCDDVGKDWASATPTQQNWQRMIMFISDTGTMKAVACEQKADDQSCADLGMGGGAPASGSSTAISDTEAPSYCRDGTASGKEKVVCSAWLFNDYGYNDPGHRGNASFLKGFLPDVKTCVSGNFGSSCKYAKGTLLVDCSGLVDAAVYDAFGDDLAGAATGGYPGNPNLTEIPISQAAAGDIIWNSDHTEVVVSNDPATKTLHTFGAHMVYPDVSKDIGPATYSYSYFQKAFAVKQ